MTDVLPIAVIGVGWRLPGGRAGDEFRPLANPITPLTPMPPTHQETDPLLGAVTDALEEAAAGLEQPVRRRIGLVVGQPGPTSGSTAHLLARTFGCQGPIISLDIGETSGLYAVHTAARVIRADECDHVVVVGVSGELREQAAVGAIVLASGASRFATRAPLLDTGGANVTLNHRSGGDSMGGLANLIIAVLSVRHRTVPHGAISLVAPGPWTSPSRMAVAVVGAASGIPVSCVLAEPPPSLTTHPLLTALSRTSSDQWEGSFALDKARFLDEHHIRELPELPGTTYTECVLAATAPGAELREIVYHGGGRITAESVLRLTVSSARDRFAVTTLRQDGAGWFTHATGAVLLNRPPARRVAPAELRGPMIKYLNRNQFYDRLSGHGHTLFGASRCVEHVWLGRAEAVTRMVVLPEVQRDLGEYAFHPALLDACWQVAVIVVGQEVSPVTPVTVREIGMLRVSAQPHGPVWAHVVRTGAMTTDLEMTDEDGRVLAEVTGLRLHAETETERLSHGICEPD